MSEPNINDNGDLQRSAAELLQIEIIPGTHVMRDVNELHFAHAGGHGSVLIPQPTTVPADPLNWSKMWKALAMASVALYTCFSAASAISMSPLFPLFGKQWNLNETQEIMITGSTVLVMGYGNFIVIPFSNIFGRRAAFLAFGILYLVCTIWQAVAQSYGSFLAARCLVGLAASPSESMVVQVVADMFFLHERGTWVGFSMLAAFFGTFIGPVIAGAMGEHYGWRSFFWLSLGLYAFSMVLILTFFPETKWPRFSQTPQLVPATYVGAESADEPKQEQSASQVEAVEVSTEMVGHGKPVRRQYLPLQKPDARWKEFVVHDFFAPFRIAIYPIIFWASLCLMGSADMVLMFNLTESFILSVSPYDMSSDQVGYTNFAFAVGAIIGVATAGPLSDWTIKRATTKNGGIREAEMRLPALIPYFILLTTGVAVAAAAIQNHWPWEVLVIMGYGSAGLGITSLPTIGIAYAVDCYKPISGELMIVATVFKNTIGFSFAYWVPSLAEEHGFMRPLMVWFTFTALPFILAIPLYFWGKSLRRLTRNSSVHRYEEHM